MARIYRCGTNFQDGRPEPSRKITNTSHILPVSCVGTKASRLAGTHRRDNLPSPILPVLIWNNRRLRVLFQGKSSLTPPPDLLKFLKSGPPPIYIIFGSIVVDNPEQLARTVLEAVKLADIRAVISRGWSKIVGEPDAMIYFVGD